MPIKERSYKTSDGVEFTLRSERTILKGDSGWQLDLELFRISRVLGKRRVSRRLLEKSSAWNTSSIELLQAQEELEMLTDAGLELTILDILNA